MAFAPIDIVFDAPSFFRPTISTAQPLVKAGDAVSLHGQHFPTAVNLATALPVSLEHDSRNPSVILGAAPGGVCFNGGGTDFEFGPVGGALRTDRLLATAQGACAPGTTAQPLTPLTSYQFGARDCDPFTCSPWSAIARATTARIDRSMGNVLLVLDRQVPLGGAAIDGNGNFDTPITIQRARRQERTPFAPPHAAAPPSPECGPGSRGGGRRPGVDHGGRTGGRGDGLPQPPAHVDPDRRHVHALWRRLRGRLGGH